MNRKEILRTLKKCSVKYIDEIINYLDFASKSNVITNDRDRKLTHLGYRIITHIFQTNLIHTGDIDASNYSMQKGYLYYLEYLEQTEKSNANNDLNHQSATLFIYEKSIINYTHDKRSPVSLDPTVLSIIPRITKLIETIIWLENNLLKQTDIDFDAVKMICEILYNSEDNFINDYIEFGQKRNMTTIEYNEFLHHTLKIFKENSKHKTYDERDWREHILKKLPDIEDAKNKVISKWCKWLWF
jgi:hypothetical protein